MVHENSASWDHVKSRDSQPPSPQDGGGGAAERGRRLGRSW